jgi:hypothetical protein
VTTGDGEENLDQCSAVDAEITFSKNTPNIVFNFLISPSWKSIKNHPDKKFIFRLNTALKFGDTLMFIDFDVKPLNLELQQRIPEDVVRT